MLIGTAGRLAPLRDMIESSAELIAVITAGAAALTSVIVAIQYSRCRVVKCGCINCEQDVESQP